MPSRIGGVDGESDDMPIVFVTPLGSNASGASAAIGQIIDYLERGARRPQPNASIVGYYADTPTAAGVWRGCGAEKAVGVWAASYRHRTNRNLEPQLHDHVVIANIGAAEGRTQALDSRLLHHHAKTAGDFAGAGTRRHISETLGVGWQSVERGLADIDGFTRNQIATFSTRRAEVTTLTDELGLDSAARAVAARAARADLSA